MKKEIETAPEKIFDSNNELQTYVDQKVAEKKQVVVPHKKNLKVAFFYLAAFSMIGFYYIFGKFVYWSMIDTKPPIQITRIWTDAPVVSRKKPIVIKFEYKKDRYCEGIIVRYLISENGKHVFLSESPSYLQKGETENKQEAELIFEFPKYLSSGKWTFKSIGHYKCNPITSSYVETQPITIKVTDN